MTGAQEQAVAFVTDVLTGKYDGIRGLSVTPPNTPSVRAHVESSITAKWWEHTITATLSDSTQIEIIRKGPR